MGNTLIMSRKELLRKSVFEHVNCGAITQVDAAKRLKLSYRHTKHSYQRYLKEGDEGLRQKSRGKRYSHAYPAEFKQAVLEVYQSKYWDLVRHSPPRNSKKMRDIVSIQKHCGCG